MIKSRTLAAGALLTLLAATGHAAGPDPIGPDAYDRLSSDFASQTIVVWWGPQATPAARAAALSVVSGEVVATDDDGAQILSTEVGNSQARVLLEQFPSAIISSVESTDAFVGNQFGLDSHMLEILTIPDAGGQSMLVPVIIEGGVYTLELVPHSVRSADFRLLVEGANGELVEVEAPAPTTYRGRVVEMPGSSVAANMGPDGLTATIVLDDEIDTGWFVQPLNEVVDGAPSDLYVVYEGASTRATDVTCGGAILDNNSLFEADPQGFGSSRGDLITAEIAFDADYQFYLQNGSSTSSTTNDINNVMNAVNVVYERDCGVTFVITEIIIRTSSGSNPYTSNDAGTLLNQFRSQWLGNHGGVHRDLAHLMTGRNIDGGTIGIAWLSAVCTSNGFGLSQSRFTSNFNSRVALTAHEIGHNFSANHCSGSSCKIMCAGLGGCGGVGLPNFSSGSANTISSYAANRPCLDSGPPPNQPPSINIVLPFDDATVDEGDTVSFAAQVDDPEEGNIGDDAVWSSSIDGVFGTGQNFNYAGLSAGTHTITASIADSGGLTDMDTTVLHVESVGGSAPDQPERPTTQDLGGGIARINWTDLPNETEWDVQREEKVGGVWGDRTTVASGLAQDTTSYDDAAGFGTFRYRIRARNAAGNSPWTAWRNRKLVDGNPPSAPTGFDAVDAGGGQVLLTWTDTSDSETRFQIQRQEKISGSWVNQGLIAQPSANTETYTDNPGSGRFRYRVRARNGSGASGWTPWGDGVVVVN